MARLPLIDPEATSGDIRASFDRMPVKLNIFRMMAHAEANMIPAMRLGNSILHRQKLGAVNRELLILQAAQLEGGAYEWRQHVPIALRVGLTPDEVAGVADGARSISFTQRQQTLLAVADELLDRHELSDATWGAVQATLREREAIELCLLIGHYQGLASAIGGLGIQIEQTARAERPEEP